MQMVPESLNWGQSNQRNNGAGHTTVENSERISQKLTNVKKKQTEMPAEINYRKKIRVINSTSESVINNIYIN